MNPRKIAAVPAFIIGAMAVVAGGQVLFLGKQMDYFVINWLPVYNFIAGLVTVSVTSVLIWKGSRYGMFAAIATFIAHAVVMLVLLTVYKDVVALDSIMAMSVRLTVWGLILVFLYLKVPADRAAIS
jgi:hypothetical protein